jgi:hypothetical protein
MDAVHIAVQRRLQNAKEHCSGDIAHVEEGEADGQFRWLVPIEDQGNDAWPEAC